MADFTVGQALLLGTVPAALGWGLSEMSRFFSSSRDSQQRRDTDERDRVFGFIAAAQTVAHDMGALMNSTIAEYAGNTVPQDQMDRLITEYNDAQRDVTRFTTEIAVFGPAWIAELADNFNSEGTKVNKELMELQTNYSDSNVNELHIKVAAIRALAGPALTSLTAQHMTPSPSRWRKGASRRTPSENP